MKTNFVHFFNFLGLLATHYNDVRAQSLSDIVFENHSLNQTWLFNSEHYQDAFCEYDVCHQVMDSSYASEWNKQWVAFSSGDGIEVISYDICLGMGKDAIFYDHGLPKCVEYSGASINVTSTINNVMAVGDNIESIQVQRVRENDTESDASYTVYQIAVNLFSSASFPSMSPAILPISNSSFIPADSTSRQTNQIWLPLTIFTLVASGLLFYLCAKCRALENQEKLSENKSIGKKYGSFFSSCPRILGEMQNNKKEEKTMDYVI